MKLFFFLINTECWLTNVFYLVVEIDSRESHTINRVGRTGRDINLYPVEYISTEASSDFYVIEDLDGSII